MDISERRIIKQIKRRTSKKTLITPIPKVINKLENIYFLQFCRGNKNLVHSIVPENRVSWPTGIQPGQRQVVIELYNEPYIATVLCVHHDIEYLRKEYEKLRMWCYEKGSNEFYPDDMRPNAKDNWLMVQYNCGPFIHITAIAHRRDTCRQDNNPYKEDVIYFHKDRRIYQAIILRRDRHVKRLLGHLTLIQNECRNLTFPLPDDHYNSNFSLPPPNYCSLSGISSFFEDYSQFETETVVTPKLREMEESIQDRIAKNIESIKILRLIRHDLLQD